MMLCQVLCCFFVTLCICLPLSFNAYIIIFVFIIVLDLPTLPMQALAC